MAQRKGKGRGWVFRWREFDPVLGREVQRTSIEYAKKSTCEAKEAEKQREIAEAKERERARRGAMTFATVLERWAAAPNKSGKPKSKRYSEEGVAALTAIAVERKWDTTTDITADDVDQWHAAITGINRNLAVLKSVLKFARRVLRQRVDPVVFDYSPRPSRDPLPPELHTSEDIAHAIADADAYDRDYRGGEDGEERIEDGRMGTLVRHHVIYGPRSVTLAALTVGDYNEVAKRLTLRRLKNGRTIEHPVHDDEAHGFMARRLSRLCAGRAPEEPLYRTPTGTSWFGPKSRAQHGIATWFRRHCMKHLQEGRRGIYLLKDWAITQMELAGIDDRTKATFTGHTSMRSFLAYKGTNARMAQSALERIPALPTLSASSAGAGHRTGHSGAPGHETGHTPHRAHGLNQAESTKPTGEAGRTGTAP